MANEQDKFSAVQLADDLGEIKIELAVLLAAIDGNHDLQCRDERAGMVALIRRQMDRNGLPGP